MAEERASLSTYTSLRVKVKLKREYISHINRIIFEHSWCESDLDFMREYSTIIRADFIPDGVLMGEPDEWDSDYSFITQTY